MREIGRREFLLKSTAAAATHLFLPPILRTRHTEARAESFEPYAEIYEGAEIFFQSNWDLIPPPSIEKQNVNNPNSAIDSPLRRRPHITIHEVENVPEQFKLSPPLNHVGWGVSTNHIIFTKGYDHIPESSEKIRAMCYFLTGMAMIKPKGANRGLYRQNMLKGQEPNKLSEMEIVNHAINHILVLRTLSMNDYNVYDTHLDFLHTNYDPTVANQIITVMDFVITRLGNLNYEYFQSFFLNYLNSNLAECTRILTGTDHDSAISRLEGALTDLIHSADDPSKVEEIIHKFDIIYPPEQINNRLKPPSDDNQYNTDPWHINV